MITLAALLPFWDKLSDEQQQAIAQGTLQRTVKKGQLVHNGDGDCAGLIGVACGRLRAYALSEEGREITLYRLLERDICLFSASCMLRGVDFNLYVEAETDSVLLILAAKVYARLLAESTYVAAFTNEIMAQRFSDVMWLLDQTLYKRFDARLAAFLLEEGAYGQQEVRLTHEKIGQHLGTAREVVTRMLRYFAAEGMVELGRGKIHLRDIKALRALARGSIR